MFSRAIGIYQRSLRSYPIISQAVQAGVLMGFGDVICQKLIEKREEINWTRTGKFASAGCFFVGPVLRNWYGILDKYVGTTGKYIGFKKMAIDQFLFAPVFLAIMLALLNVLQNLTFAENVRQLKKVYPPILMTNYMLWPAVQTINFQIVPLNYQVLVAQTVAIIWNTYLSWKAHEKLEKEQMSD